MCAVSIKKGAMFIMTGSVQVNKGKWYCVLNFKDENGKRKLKWISTGLPEKGNKKKAQAMLQELQVKYEGYNTITNYADMPFADYCEHWLTQRKDEVDVITYQNYEYRIAHIKDYFAPRRTTLSKVTPRDIKDFYHYLLSNGNRAKYKSQQGLSQRSIKDIAMVLRLILREAVALKDIRSNPTEEVTIPKKKAEVVRSEQFIDENDMKILLSEIKGHALEELITITLFYGLRRSEVLGLRWDAINFDDNTVLINHTVVKVKGKIAKDSTKTQASFRTYPLPEYIKAMLLKLKGQQQKNRVLFGKEYLESDYVFTWEDGRTFSPDYVTKAFKKIVSKSEFLPSELTFHDLRKSCVSMMVEAGFNVKEIQKWVGHADVETTLNIYAKVKESRKKHIGTSMEEKFKNAI